MRTQAYYIQLQDGLPLLAHTQPYIPGDPQPEVAGHVVVTRYPQELKA